MSGVRIDKWLWAARFFKTRSLASKACELGRIEYQKQTVKPSREVQVGDLVNVRNEGGEFEVQVLALSDIRGPASVARTLYRETESSREKRALIAEQRKAGLFFSPAPEHRPSKRDRRRIHQFRGER